jgi:hypothetical protein
VFVYGPLDWQLPFHSYWYGLASLSETIVLLASRNVPRKTSSELASGKAREGPILRPTYAVEAAARTCLRKMSCLLGDEEFQDLAALKLECRFAELTARDHEISSYRASSFFGVISGSPGRCADSK